MLRCGLDALLASCRATTLKTALLEHLLPQLGGELRAKLLADAQQAVLGQVSDKLWEYASEAPTQVTSDAARITHWQYCRCSIFWTGSRLLPGVAHKQKQQSGSEHQLDRRGPLLLYAGMQMTAQQSRVCHLSTGWVTQQWSKKLKRSHRMRRQYCVLEMTCA